MGVPTTRTIDRAMPPVHLVLNSHIPRRAHNSPGIVSWLGKPDLAIVEKLQKVSPLSI